MRGLFYSEIVAIHSMNNLPEDPDLPIAAGAAYEDSSLWTGR
jgi:hypothetical protein